MTDEKNFSHRQERAMEQMREMQQRASKNFPNMPPAPPFVKIPSERKNEQQPKSELKGGGAYTANGGGSIGKGLNLPFLDQLKTDKDAGLILGLMLILLSESSDRLLLLSLVYILI